MLDRGRYHRPAQKPGGKNGGMSMKNTIARIFPIGLILVGVCLLTMSVLNYCGVLWPVYDGTPQVVVAQTTIELGEAPAGETCKFVIRLHNQSSEPWKVVGCGFC
jgi:hypothetical protein